MGILSLSVDQLADVISRDSRIIKSHLKNAEMHRTRGDGPMRWREVSAVLDNLKEIKMCVERIDGAIKICLVEMHKSKPNEEDIKKRLYTGFKYFNKI